MGATLSGAICTSLIVLMLPACGVASRTTAGLQNTYSNIFVSGEVRAAKLRQADDAKCQSLGFKPGTDGGSGPLCPATI